MVIDQTLKTTAGQRRASIADVEQQTDLALRLRHSSKNIRFDDLPIAVRVQVEKNSVHPPNPRAAFHSKVQFNHFACRYERW
jgi:hypothetical protein